MTALRPHLWSQMPVFRPAHRTRVRAAPHRATARTPAPASTSPGGAEPRPTAADHDRARRDHGACSHHLSCEPHPATAGTGFRAVASRRPGAERLERRPVGVEAGPANVTRIRQSPVLKRLDIPRSGLIRRAAGFAVPTRFVSSWVHRSLRRAIPRVPLSDVIINRIGVRDHANFAGSGWN